jgi:hypothetical protein
MRAIVPEDLERLTTIEIDRTIRSLVRAAIATGVAKLDSNIRPAAYAARQWPNDRTVEHLIRGAVSPLSTSSAPPATVTAAFLTTLIPVSAGADLLARGLGLNFNGAVQVNVPAIAVPVCDFVGELAPFPVQSAPTTPGATLSPHKLGVITNLTAEMMQSSNAEAMTRAVLIESTGPAVDKVLFSANAAAADRPAGLLNGIAGLTPAAAGAKDQAIVDDLQALATAVAPVAGNGNIALVAAPAQAVAIALRSPRQITWPLLTSASRPHRHRGRHQRARIRGRGATND